MKPTDRYLIGPGLRAKLREVISIVDGVPRGGDRTSIPTRLQDGWMGAARGMSVRLGTVSSTWGKGTTATVTRVQGDGTAISPTETFEAKNWFATVTVATGTKKVACAKVDETWILIAAEC